MNHLNVPLRFEIYGRVGNCYAKLGSYMEALTSYEKAFSGQEILLGGRHYDTLCSLKWMISMNHGMDQKAKVLRLSDKMCMEQEFVPEMSLSDNLLIHSLRYSAYGRIGDHDSKAHMEKPLRSILKICRELYSNDDGIPPSLLFQRGHAHYLLGEYDTALESFRLELKAYEKDKKSRTFDVLSTQHLIALTYEQLGRYHEARELYETVHANEQSILGSDHRYTRNTKRDLDALIGRQGSYDDEPDDDDFDNHASDNHDSNDHDFDNNDYNNDSPNNDPNNNTHTRTTESHTQTPGHQEPDVTISDVE